jgi:hypothetical protein
MRNKIWTAALVLGILLALAVNVRAACADTSTAQGVAELQAQHQRCRHFGGNRGYEGTGKSSAGPEDALRRCCFSNSGMPVIDSGVALGADGNWYACKRYQPRRNNAALTPQPRAMTVRPGVRLFRRR